MLRHVGRKQDTTQPVERGHESKDEQEPTGRKGCHLPSSNAMISPRTPPKSPYTREVQSGTHREARNNARFKTPRRPEVMWRERLAVVSVGNRW
jgi:hypothetical protein